MSRPDECERCFNHVVKICAACKLCPACAERSLDESIGYCRTCVGDVLHEVRARAKNLQAIVDQYPKTEDGVSIVPRMTTWCHGLGRLSWDIRLPSGETYAAHCRRSRERHYSSWAAEQAAEATTKGGDA